ncbi:MAG: hypothetical protein V4717_14495 [Bacteroidota bacterium]
MQYELANLEKLLTSPEPGQGDFESFNLEQIVLLEVKNIKIAWRKTACTSLQPSVLQNYVRQHQLALITIGSHLYKENYGITNWQVFLEDLFLFILEAFPDIMDKHLLVPNFCLAITRNNLKKQLADVESHFKLRNVPEYLAEAIIDGIDDWIYEDKEQHITYYRLSFYEWLRISLKSISTNNSSTKKFTTNLVNTICYVNYNSEKVFNSIKEYILSQIKENEDPALQLKYLWNCHLHFKHLPVRHELFFRPDDRILARSLSDWIRRLISSKEKELYSISDESILETSVESTTKLMTSLSIEELALLLRGFIEIGVIRIKKNGLSSLVRFMSQNVRTLTKGVYDEFKPETLYKYYYSISLTNLKSVQNILRRILRKIDDIENIMKNEKLNADTNRSAKQ